MASGEFLQGLSEGVFERLGGMRKEQEAKDEREKLQLINLLAGLEVEPDSRPLLMKHLGSIIGVKGKMKDFWNAFSGMPDRSIGDQLGTIMKDVTSSMVGPQEARQARGKAALRSISGALGGGMTPYKTPATLADRLILRDPRQERMEEIESRYGLQSQTALEKQALLNQFKAQQQEDAQRHQKEMVDVRADSKAREDIRERAWGLATEFGFSGPNKALEVEAAKQLAQEQGWTNEKLQAQISYLRAKAGEAEATTRFMSQNEGLTPYQDINVEDRRREAAGKISSFYVDAMKSRAEARKKMDDIAASLNEKLSRGKSKSKFDPKTGSIIAGPGELGPDILFKEALKEYREAAAKFAGAETQAKGYWGKLRMDPYKKYYKVGATFEDPVEEILEQKKKAVPPPKAQKRALNPRERVGMGTQGIRVPEAQGKTEGYFPGDKRTIGGRSYIVRELRNGFWILDSVTNK